MSISRQCAYAAGEMSVVRLRVVRVVVRVVVPTIGVTLGGEPPGDLGTVRIRVWEGSIDLVSIKSMRV